MRRTFHFVFFFTTFFSLNTFAQNTDQLTVDVVYLSADYLQGREVGTTGEALAATYIGNRFSDLGLHPKGDAGTYLQSFPFKEMVDTDSEKMKEGKGSNVIGYLHKGAATTVIIGAHFDHLGVQNNIIQHGANDNASGIAAMLYLAEQLLKKDANNNYLFVGFSGTEKSLAGSTHFLENLPVEPTSINYMLNLDNVGLLDAEHTITMNGAGTSSEWKKAIWMIRSDDIKTNLTDSGVGNSDHTSFYLKDIPALHITTKIKNSEQKDIAENINFEGIQIVANYTLKLIEAMDKKGKIDFIETEEKKESRRVSKYKVTLGVMPDYAFADGGMKIISVLADRPAQKAGLQDGDIVLKVGTYDIKDIYAYMDVLGKYEPGTTVDVIVKRGNEKITKKVEF